MLPASRRNNAYRDVSIQRSAWMSYGLRLDESCCVLYVAPGSDAAHDGIRVGSSVVGVDGGLVCTRDDFAREWLRGQSSQVVTITFDEKSLPAVMSPVFPPPPSPAPGGASLVSAAPRKLFFPAKALKRKKEVVNTITLTNYSSSEMLFVLRSSHPTDVFVRQREGILLPSGAEGHTAQVEVVWTHSNRYDFTQPHWGPFSVEYPQLNPPQQPVVTVVCWPRELGVSLRQVDPRDRTETELPVSFSRPVDRTDEYDFAVAGVPYRSSESEFASSVMSRSEAAVSSAASSPKMLFQQQLLANERDRAEFRRSRQPQFPPPPASNLSWSAYSLPASLRDAGPHQRSPTHADAAALREKEEEIASLRRELEDLRKDRQRRELSRSQVAEKEKNEDGWCVVL
eukprot:TRINITY_DN3025_c0_g2_i1.p1 TRINITY_DN3025_c0_g2~~TRINITY_DN3025_c0_g2_i1.p1  ORF type:complete len:398 (+),score=55.80 TRINITY_DN3025_c0_g2_i1:107-1300(+)